ncbi:MAG: ABC transporter permease [Chloroflexota bacterium]
MSTRVSTASPAVREALPPHIPAGGGLRKALSDGLIVTWRNLKRVPRIPELAILAVLQSIMFVLLFAFVFGGAIPLPEGGSYREFLMPGIFAQTVIFAAATTAVGITDDVGKGIVDRFRSLPMERSAVLSGRALFDLIYNAGILIVLMVSGLAVGWRVHSSVPEFFAGVGLLLLFTFAMSWIGITLGLYVRTVESANQVGFTVLFPLTFLSNVFVPPQTLPSWLRPVAEWNPVSVLTASIRDLWGNPNPYASGGFPAENSILLTFIWVGILLAIFIPLGVWRYRSMSR